MKSGGSTKGRLSFVINAIITGAIVFVALLMLLTLMTQNGGSLLGLRSYIVVTGSMSPAFDEGSYIFVQERSANQINSGDVISYVVGDGETVLTHRVVEKSGMGDATIFITQGDANNTRDEKPVEAARVLGVEVLAVPGFGALLLSLRNPVNIAYALGIILVIFLAPEVYRRLLRAMGETSDLAEGGGALFKAFKAHTHC